MYIMYMRFYIFYICMRGRGRERLDIRLSTYMWWNVNNWGNTEEERETVVLYIIPAIFL